MTLKNDEKSEEELTCCFKIDKKEFDEFWLKNFKVSNICTLLGCFWPKYIMFELKAYRGVMLYGTEHLCRICRKTDLCFQKGHEEFRKFSPQHVRKSKNQDFDGILLCKVKKVWT